MPYRRVDRGHPSRTYSDIYLPGTEPLGEGEIRVTVLGNSSTLGGSGTRTTVQAGAGDGQALLVADELAEDDHVGQLQQPSWTKEGDTTVLCRMLSRGDLTGALEALEAPGA